MKIMAAVFLLLLGIGSWICFQSFTEWFLAQDRSQVQMERSGYKQAEQVIDRFFNSRAAMVFQKINLDFLKDYEARLWHQRALAIYQRGGQRAEDAFAKAKAEARRPRTKAEIAFNAADQFLRRSEWEAAVAAYQENLKIYPNHWPTKNNLELLLKQKEEAEKGKGREGQGIQSARGGNKRSKFRDLEIFSSITLGKKKVDK